MKGEGKMKNGLLRRALILVVILILSVPISAGREYWCKTDFQCPLQWFLCHSDTRPRSIGHCIFQCYEYGGWMPEIWCPIVPPIK